MFHNIKYKIQLFINKRFFLSDVDKVEHLQCSSVSEQVHIPADTSGNICFAWPKTKEAPRREPRKVPIFQALTARA